MAENKTKPTNVDVEKFLDKAAGASRRADCATLVKIMKRVTKAKPVMWGPSIVGFGSYTYTYASGHGGTMCIAGFSPRTSDLTVYLMGRFDGKEALLKKLGKHKGTKACVYIKKLEDVDLAVLEELIRRCVDATRALYGS
jgi:hypothetical protein